MSSTRHHSIILVPSIIGFVWLLFLSQGSSTQLGIETAWQQMSLGAPAVVVSLAIVFGLILMPLILLMTAAWTDSRRR